VVRELLPIAEDAEVKEGRSACPEVFRAIPPTMLGYIGTLKVETHKPPQAYTCTLSQLAVAPIQPAMPP
jgi:hypothetical protein